LAQTVFWQRLGTTNDADDANDAKSRAFPRRRLRTGPVTSFRHTKAA
jgi:hypothetical protein